MLFPSAEIVPVSSPKLQPSPLMILVCFIVNVSPSIVPSKATLTGPCSRTPANVLPLCELIVRFAAVPVGPYVPFHAPRKSVTVVAADVVSDSVEGFIGASDLVGGAVVDVCDWVDLESSLCLSRSTPNLIPTPTATSTTAISDSP